MSYWMPLLAGVAGGALAAAAVSRRAVVPPTTLDGATSTSMTVWRFKLGTGPWQRFQLSAHDGSVAAVADDGSVLFDVPARDLQVSFPRHGGGFVLRWPGGRATFAPYERPDGPLPASARALNREAAGRAAALVAHAAGSR